MLSLTTGSWVFPVCGPLFYVCDGGVVRTKDLPFPEPLCQVVPAQLEAWCCKKKKKNETGLENQLKTNHFKLKTNHFTSPSISQIMRTNFDLSACISAESHLKEPLLWIEMTASEWSKMFLNCTVDGIIGSRNFTSGPTPRGVEDRTCSRHLHIHAHSSQKGDTTKMPINGQCWG